MRKLPIEVSRTVYLVLIILFALAFLALTALVVVLTLRGEPLPASLEAAYWPLLTGLSGLLVAGPKGGEE